MKSGGKPQQGRGKTASTPKVPREILSDLVGISDHLPMVPTGSGLANFARRSG